WSLPLSAASRSGTFLTRGSASFKTCLQRGIVEYQIGAPWPEGRSLMRALAKVALVLMWTVLVPATTFAQATITGTVKDTSGAVLPGVTVEAASPVLIEKVRSAVTDSSGLYRIVDLRPGTYTVTFSLPGFTTVRREGLELAGSATLSIPAEMRVGSLQESVTVTGATPVVDVQNARSQTVLSADVIAALPATRAYG